MKTLNNVEFKILPKSGLDVNINTLVTNAIASAGELHYTTDSKNLYFNNGTSNVQLATVDAVTDNGNSSTADTVDRGTGNIQKSTLTGNCTYTFTAPDGPGNYRLIVIQDGTGSRTVTRPGTVKRPGGTAPTLTTTASATDIISFLYDGTSYFGVEVLALS